MTDIIYNAISNSGQFDFARSLAREATDKPAELRSRSAFLLVAEIFEKRAPRDGFRLHEYFRKFSVNRPDILELTALFVAAGREFPDIAIAEFSKCLPFLHSCACLSRCPPRNAGEIGDNVLRKPGVTGGLGLKRTRHVDLRRLRLPRRDYQRFPPEKNMARANRPLESGRHSFFLRLLLRASCKDSSQISGGVPGKASGFSRTPPPRSPPFGTPPFSAHVPRSARPRGLRLHFANQCDMSTPVPSSVKHR